jgi:hypothetical protein
MSTGGRGGITMLRATDTWGLAFSLLYEPIDRGDVSGLVVRGIEVATHLDRGCSGGVEVQACGVDSGGWVVGKVNVSIVRSKSS